MKQVLLILAGALGMYILLRILSNKDTAGTSQTTDKFYALAETAQAMNLIKTNEFRELAKTTEFRDLVTTLADEQIAIIANSLTTNIF